MWVPPERVSGVCNCPYVHNQEKHPHYTGVHSLIALCTGSSICRLRNPHAKSEFLYFSISQKSPNKASDYMTKINKTELKQQYLQDSIFQPSQNHCTLSSKVLPLLHNNTTMKNTNITLLIALSIVLPMMLSCRSTRQQSSNSLNTTTISTTTADSIAKRLMSQHRKTTSITVLPMQTPGLKPLPKTDVQAPVQDLITQLIEQGGGTIIIEEDEQLQQDQSTIINHESVQDTTTTQNTHHEQTTSNPPRASPIIDKIFYIFLLLPFIIILLQGRNRQ